MNHVGVLGPNCSNIQKLFLEQSKVYRLRHLIESLLKKLKRRENKQQLKKKKKKPQEKDVVEY